jgi:hypothetical protein
MADVQTQLPDCSAYFSDPAHHVWLNTAHQGPMPTAAVRAASEAAQEKSAPYRIPDAAFTERPERLRSMLAAFVGGSPEEIVLGDSTSHGLNVIAYGLSWRDGDEVLCVEKAIQRPFCPGWPSNTTAYACGSHGAIGTDGSTPIVYEARSRHGRAWSHSPGSTPSRARRRTSGRSARSAGRAVLSSS